MIRAELGLSAPGEGDDPIVGFTAGDLWVWIGFYESAHSFRLFVDGHGHAGCFPGNGIVAAGSAGGGGWDAHHKSGIVVEKTAAGVVGNVCAGNVWPLAGSAGGDGI